MPVIKSGNRKKIEEEVLSVKIEVIRQLELRGEQFDDQNTANDWIAYICHYVSEGAYNGRQEQYHPAQSKSFFKKAAASCISAMLAIERNGSCAPRHYEQPKNIAKEATEG